MFKHFPTSRLSQYFLPKISKPDDPSYRQSMAIREYSLNLLGMRVSELPFALLWTSVVDIRSFYIKMANQRNVEFVQISLDKSGKPAFEKWAKDAVDDYPELMEQITIAGYKMSVSHDFDNDCFICALTGKKNAPLNAGKCFTTRAGDLVEVIMLALYKHLVLAKSGDWSKIETRDSNWG